MAMHAQVCKPLQIKGDCLTFAIDDAWLAACSRVRSICHFLLLTMDQRWITLAMGYAKLGAYCNALHAQLIQPSHHDAAHAS